MNTVNKTIIALIHDEFEDLEFWYPVLRLREAGVKVLVAGEEANKTYRGKYGVPAAADISYQEALLVTSHGLLVPGGWAPDKLRRYQEVLELVRHADRDHNVIGQICHAGWVLISAGILKGRKVTSTPGIKDDMTNAGALWLDVPSVVDGNMVSARRPPDLPQYMKDFLQVLMER